MFDEPLAPKINFVPLLENEGFKAPNNAGPSHMGDIYRIKDGTHRSFMIKLYGSVKELDPFIQSSENRSPICKVLA